MDPFTRQYMATALWSSTGDDGEPLDGTHDTKDIHPDTMAKMDADCQRFQAENGATMEGYKPSRCGHDFWLTRNRHGAGFWDGDYEEPDASTLTSASHSFGEVELYVGDDGKIHQS